MDFTEFITEFIPNTQEMHAIAAHLPVALSMLGPLILVAALLIKTDREVLRWVAAATYLVLAGTAYIAVETGEDSRSEVSGAIAKSIWDILDDHENMAEYVWIFGVCTALLIAASALTRHVAQRSFGIAAMIAALATAVWVGLTGHHGGTLVYKHGIGIPPDQVVEWRINPPKIEGRKIPELSEEEKAIREEDLIKITEIDPEEAAKVSYMNDSAPLMEEVCTECHKEGDLDSEYDMTTAANIIKGGEKYGASVIPGEPDESTLIKYVRGALLPQMPEDEMPLLREEVHLLRMWIYAGAKDDSESAGE